MNNALFFPSSASKFLHSLKCNPYSKEPLSFKLRNVGADHCGSAFFVSFSGFRIFLPSFETFFFFFLHFCLLLSELSLFLCCFTPAVLLTNRSLLVSWLLVILFFSHTFFLNPSHFLYCGLVFNRPPSVVLAVFLPADAAHAVLRRLRRANFLLEEIKFGNIQRECREEICSYEEAREAFEDDEKTVRTAGNLFFFNHGCLHRHVLP